MACQRREYRLTRLRLEGLILKHKALGFTLRETAKLLHIHEGHASVQWRRIKRKFGSNKPFQIARMAGMI